MIEQLLAQTPDIGSIDSIGQFLDRHGWPAMTLVVFLFIGWRLGKWGGPRADKFLEDHSQLVQSLPRMLDEHGNEIADVKKRWTGFTIMFSAPMGIEGTGYEAES